MEATIAAATTAAAPLTLAALPALGQALDAGIFAGLTTTREGTHCAVVLLPNKATKALKWKDAIAWAAELNVELPTRAVAALLFANARDEFEPAWHWTSEAFDGSCAWFQFFYDGSQSLYLKSYEGRARAVRLIPLVA